MSAFTDLLFSPAELIQFCTFSAALGGVIVKLRQMEKDNAKLDIKVDRNHDHVINRQEILEVRHIAAVEKLGEALSDFADDIRDRMGDHQSRLNFLEKTQ